jgi:hypothetical protein
MQHRRSRDSHRLGGELFGPASRAFFPVKNVGPGNPVVLAAHQRELDLILHVFDVEGATLPDPGGRAATVIPRRRPTDERVRHHFAEADSSNVLGAPR